MVALLLASNLYFQNTLTESHKTLASIPWREIITTNYDLLVEQAFDAIIAAKLIERLVPKANKQYLYYERIFRTVEIGSVNSMTATNLLKSLIQSDEFSPVQIDKLYDYGYARLSDDPYYLLNYAINLQYRRNENSLLSALEHLKYAESLLDKRNHKFIHRRAVINFELAKIHYERESELDLTLLYMREAKELFCIKQLMDPFSAYSYVDYIKLLIWELNKIEYEAEEELQGRIEIENLFDLATDSMKFYFSIVEKYSEVFLKDKLAKVMAKNPKEIRASRAAFFNYLVHNEKAARNYPRA